MIKKLLALTAACALVLGLAACGGSDSSQSSAAADTKSESAASESTAAEETAAEDTSVSGEVFDVGEFTVLVPDGWMALPQTDMFGEKDDDGNYPIDPASFGLIKDGTSEYDAFSKPTIYIYKNSGDAASQAEMNASFYDETSDIDVTINGTKCAAFEAKSSSYSDEDKFYVYNMVFYQVDDDTYFQFNIPIDMIDFKGVSIDDADVQAIMESVAVK